MELSDRTKKLIRQYQQASAQNATQGPTVHVDEVALRVAAFYEQIRTIVDWKEEHLMRRAAIIRKLKRRFFDLEMNAYKGVEDMAESLVLELIRGGQFPNDRIPESKIGDIQKTIDKYVFLLRNRAENNVNFYNWLLEVAACEIEERLASGAKEMALVDFMFQHMEEKIIVSDKVYASGLLKKGEEKIQIYIAVCQALFKLDNPIISYNLLKHTYEGWDDAGPDLVSAISKTIFKMWENINSQLSNPISNKFYSICEKYDTPYLILGDILSQSIEGDAAKELSEPASLERAAREAYSKRLSTLKSRISRAAVYSTVSIFITKVLSLVLLELLIERALGGQIMVPVLLADVLIPTLLMFAIVSSVKKPSGKNLNIVIMETMKLAYKKESPETYAINLRKKRGTAMKAFLSFAYVMSSFITFASIYLIFNYFGFPITSIIIDIIFIALIFFAGTAIAKKAQELTMEDEKEGFLTFISDIFLLPVQGFGGWLLAKWKKYNAITALLNALIDTPFSALVEFLEKWRYFIKERKEDIR